MSEATARQLPESWKQEKVPLFDMEPVDILIVDDLQDKLLVYSSILEELGQNVVAARSGEEALKMVLQRDFAVILLDVNMPGLDGFETAALIRKRKKSAHTPIIFLTAFMDEMHAAQGYASGAVDYLPTPVVPEVLKAKVRVFIELSQMRRQAALQAEERARRTAAEESARRLEFLVNVSEVLARPHSQQEILRCLAKQPVPYMADVCFVWLNGDEQAEGIGEWAWSVEAETFSDSLSLTTSRSIVPWLDEGLDQVLRDGNLRLMNNLPEWEAGNIPSLYGSLAPLALKLPELRHALFLPLVMRGKPAGVLVLGRKAKREAFQPSDLSLASDLASRTQRFAGKCDADRTHSGSRPAQG